MKHIIAITALATVLVPGIAAASGDHGGHKAAVQPVVTAQAGATPRADGEVRKIDKEQNKITLKHGEIKNLDMPPMTMVFRVKEAALLDQVKEGDKIRFTADRVGGQFTVTSIEK